MLPYDDSTECRYSDPVRCRNERERLQAQNIYNILQRDPTTKILVAAGYDHIFKTSDDSWVHMGEQLKIISGITPISIDLVRMSERINSSYENRFYRSALNNFPLAFPSIFVDEKSKAVFVEPAYIKKVDFQVFFPRTTYVFNLPTWYSNDYDSIYTINLSRAKARKGDLLHIYIENEYKAFGKSAIPFASLPISDIRQQKIRLPANKSFMCFLDNGKEILLLID